jgi:hypothetical protein
MRQQSNSQHANVHAGHAETIARCIPEYVGELILSCGWLMLASIWVIWPIFFGKDLSVTESTDGWIVKSP